MFIRVPLSLNTIRLCGFFTLIEVEVRDLRVHFDFLKDLQPRKYKQELVSLVGNKKEEK